MDRLLNLKKSNNRYYFSENKELTIDFYTDKNNSHFFTRKKITYHYAIISKFDLVELNDIFCEYFTKSDLKTSYSNNKTKKNIFHNDKKTLINKNKFNKQNEIFERKIETKLQCFYNFKNDGQINNDGEKSHNSSIGFMFDSTYGYYIIKWFENNPDKTRHGKKMFNFNSLRTLSNHLKQFENINMDGDEIMDQIKTRFRINSFKYNWRNEKDIVFKINQAQTNINKTHEYIAIEFYDKETSYCDKTISLILLKLKKMMNDRNIKILPFKPIIDYHIGYNKKNY
jgi:hypothetical protein